MTLDQARNAIGHRVTYVSHPGVPEREQEHGCITGVYSRFADVLYDGDAWAKATAPELLTDDGDT